MSRPADISIALTFDAEMDAFDASIVSPASPEWRGIEDGIPIIAQVLAGVLDSYRQQAVATWFVRCDDQIESITGSPSYLFERYVSLWQSRQRLGDEIAFHPHLYRENSGSWLQDNDPQSLNAHVHRSYSAMRSAGFCSKTSRIGEAFSNNAVVNALEECGIEIDSTAMPGRVRLDAQRSLDWSGTPTRRYHPAVNDYRVPGDPCRKLLEVPMSMLWTKTHYDQKPLLRYLDLSFHPRVLRDGISNLIMNSETVVTVTHPSTVLNSNSSHGLIAFSADAFAENLDLLLSECSVQNKSIRFITLSQIVD